MITKKDIVLAGCILAAAIVLWVMLRFNGNEEGSYARITIDGELYGVYSLAKDQEIHIGDTNICRIESGQVKMIQADCPDQLCIRQQAAGKEGETIVCLPNKVVIEVTEREEDTVQTP